MVGDEQQDLLSWSEIWRICGNSVPKLINEQSEGKWWKEFIEVIKQEDVQDRLFEHTELKVKIEEKWDWRGENGFMLDVGIKGEGPNKESSEIEESFQITWFHDKRILSHYSKEEQTEIIQDCVSKGLIKLMKYILNSALASNPLESSKENKEDKFLQIVFGYSYKPNSKIISGNEDERIQKLKNLVEACIEKYTQVTEQKWKDVYLYDCDGQNISFANEIIDLIKIVSSEGPEELLSKDFEKQKTILEALANPENLLLLLNSDNYTELSCDCMRWNYLNSYFQGRIYPVSCMKKGYARLLDKRALKIRICFNKFVHKNIDSDADSCKAIYDIYTSIFENFAGCLLVPKI
ncbi:hypothetical protein WEN_00580 [Mycoplasma wenyonii str. Massachusetts]|uniref:Uncharacterized protein n=1 Tax=Mycoplasma wenyonii (strain Massachusetts) TaxID=1197325 RepID=I6Z5T2_MYCWM|nr:hypothetical protein [Mycoplasma wenyonii]AFN64923.1 hypothetical protein WEN_00580 [Mycoplasma wenyonii str. Massachusetts]